MNKRIAIAIFNLIQYYSVQYALDEMIKKYDVDIYVPDFVPDDIVGDSGYLNIYNDTYNFLKKSGYKIKRKYKNEVYKIALTPYYCKNFYDFKCQFNIKYEYGVCCKPSVTFKLPDNIDYDVKLCYTTWEADFLSAFCKSYNVGDTKFYKFKKNTDKKDKPILLYLPTYGNVSNILKIDAFKKLKSKYKLIIKLHHNTSYLESEKEKMNNLNSIFDEIYFSDYKLLDLLKDADFVISDNSGAIFEAIHADVPVAIFAEKCDLSFGKLIPIQQKLINDGVLLSTDNSDELLSIIKNTLKKDQRDKVFKIKQELFPYNNEDLVNRFIDVINDYMNDNINTDYFDLHDKLRTDIKQYMKNDYDFYKQLVEANNYIKVLTKELDDYKRKHRLKNFAKRISNKIGRR